MKSIVLLTTALIFSAASAFAQTAIPTHDWKTCTVHQYSVKYPPNWDMTRNGKQMIFMQHRTNRYDFMPSVNIIVSEKKRTESTLRMAQISVDQAKATGFISRAGSVAPVTVAGLPGHCWSGDVEMDGFSLYEVQYIIKKADNSTFIISAMVESSKKSAQLKTVGAMLATLSIF